MYLLQNINRTQILSRNALSNHLEQLGNYLTEKKWRLKKIHENNSIFSVITMQFISTI